jgi:hypothetical protein
VIARAVRRQVRAFNYHLRWHLSLWKSGGHPMISTPSSRRSGRLIGWTSITCRSWIAALWETQADVLTEFTVVSTKDEPLPEAMMSPETGETLTRGVRPFTVAYKGESVVVDLPGYYPAGEGEGVHIGKDMAVVDQALRDLKEKSVGVPSPETIHRLRAFDKYERGLI